VAEWQCGEFKSSVWERCDTKYLFLSLPLAPFKEFRSNKLRRRLERRR
jgi:hypothetical protein